MSDYEPKRIYQLPTDTIKPEDFVAIDNETSGSRKVNFSDVLGTKQDTEAGKGLSTNDYTTEEKDKLADIEDEATKTIVDSVLSLISENPVQNKVVTQEINEKADVIISSASGSIAHFEDGAEADAVSVIAHIEPEQDLHGYDSPWPAGGGKNLIPYPYTETTRTVNGITFTDNGDGSITVNGTATGNAIFQIKDRSSSNTPRLVPGEVYKLTGCPTGGSSSTYKLDILKYGSATYVVDYGGSNKTFTYTEDTADDVIGQIRIVVYSGATVSNLVFKPMLTLASEIDDTWTPYSNICPITGHTEMNLVRTGENLLDDALRYQSANQQTLVFGQTKSYTAEQKTFLKAGTYTYSVKCDSTQRTSGYYRKTGDTETTRLWMMVYGDASGTFTLDVDSWCVFWVYDANSIDSENIYAQIELGSTATDYEPYDGKTYPITFPSEAGTVYGGYVDATRGKLVVDRAMHTFDGTEAFSGDGGADSVVPRWQELVAGPIYSGYAISNMFKRANSYVTIRNTTMSMTVGNGFRVLMNPFGTTYRTTGEAANAIAAWCSEMYNAGTPLQVCYKLVTPIEYDITPQQITTLLGVNNVWNDCNGVTDVTYKADTKLYIEQLTKPTEDDMVANTAIQSGKFFMVGNRLFLSTSAIASGDTINPGTNCTELSLADALNNLN